MKKLATTITVCLMLLTASAVATGFTEVFSDDFSTFDDSKFGLQDEAFYNASESAVQLTTTEKGQEAGLYYKNRLSNVWFRTTFDLSMGGGTGADGILFVYSDELLALPSRGTDHTAYAGITKGIRFDFRTYTYNSLFVKSIIDEEETLLVSIDITPELNDNGIFTAEALYLDGILSVWLENPSIGYPKTLLHSIDVSAYVPSSGYVTLSGTTGADYDNQLIHYWSLETAPIPEPALICIMLGLFGAKAIKPKK